MHLSCKCASEFAPEGQLESNWRLSSEQVGGTECSFVCHVPGPRGNSLGYFLPQQGIVSMFFSGVGRQPISALTVLFLANEGWIRVKTPHQTRIHVSLSLNTIESLFDLAKCRFWSGEAIPGVRRPVFIRVRTAYSIAAT